MRRGELEEYLADHPLCRPVRDEGGRVTAAGLRARIARLRADTPIPELYAEDYTQLTALARLIHENDRQRGLERRLKSELERKLKEKYAALTLEEIQDILISWKWGRAIRSGIDSLYTAVSHTITGRVIQLAERYEDTLSGLSARTEDREARVRVHLERMGFVW